MDHPVITFDDVTRDPVRARSDVDVVATREKVHVEPATRDGHPGPAPRGAPVGCDRCEEALGLVLIGGVR